MKTADYIEALKPLAKARSVYAVARLLEMDDSTVRHYAKGRRCLDDFAAVKIAELLDLPPMQVIADVNAERESNPVRKMYWQEMSKKLVGLSAAVVLSIGALHSNDSRALPLESSSKNIEGSTSKKTAILHNRNYRAEKVRFINYTRRAWRQLFTTVSRCISRAQTVINPTLNLTPG